MQKRLVSLQKEDQDINSGIFIDKKSDYDILSIILPNIDWNIMVEAYTLFHHAFMKARKKDRSVLFLFDLSNTEFKNISMTAIQQFANCHSIYKNDYSSWLLGTFILFSEKNKMYAGTLNYLLNIFYTPIRPLKITTYRNDLESFVEKTKMSTDVNVENCIECKEIYNLRS